MGSFNSLSPGQGLAKEDAFPCLPPPHFSALQLLRALWCSLLPPCPLLELGPSDSMWWDHTGADEEQG